MEDKTIELLNFLLKGGSTSLTKSNTSEVLEIFPKLRNLGILTFSGRSSYHLNTENRKSLKKLLELNSFEKYLFWLDKKEELTEVKSTSSEMNNDRKIFISHSKKDLKFVEDIIDILDAIGVRSESIFCSSLEGYNVSLGNDFLQSIRGELSSDVMVIFILSNNFFSSPVCLCEMGATWVSTKEHIPILIPPFDYSDMKGVIPPTKTGMKIDEKEKYNSFKERIEVFLKLNQINHSVWERKRDKILNSIDDHINSSSKTKYSNESEVNLIQKETSKGRIEAKKDKKVIESEKMELQGKIFALQKNGKGPYYLNEKEIDECIKEAASESYPDDYSMQAYQIKNQRKALEELKKNRPTDIPINHYNKIRLKAAKFGVDFEMQLYKMNQLFEDFRKLQKL